MVLKEAYRYQNHLNELISTAETYLVRDDFITKTVETHNRKKANPDADNEIIEKKSSLNVDFEPMDIVNFINKALNEKQKLSNAIIKAKMTTEIDVDTAIATNKMKQAYISVLTNMSKVKSSENVTRGTGYKFNNDGVQSQYYYDVTSVTTINYDRNDVRNIIKKLSRETEETSLKVDVIQSTTEVNFEPKWDITDTLEDVVLV